MRVVYKSPLEDQHTLRWRRGSDFSAVFCRERNALAECAFNSSSRLGAFEIAGAYAIAASCGFFAGVNCCTAGLCRARSVEWMIYDENI